MHIYTYIMSAHIHIHIYTHTHTKCTSERTQNTSETTARQRLRGKPNLMPRSSALLPVRCNPERDTLRGQQPNCPSRGTTDKRRTTTTNSSSSHHHDSAPSRPHPLICTGAEPIQAVPPRNEVILLPFWRGLSVQKLFVYVFDLCYLHGSDFIQLCSGGVGYS